MFELLAAIGGIVLLDIVLSGDNALVIGAAASGLPPKQRWLAIMLGGGGAIVLRILFALIATFLLRLPLLQAIGGALLLIIAVRLLMDRTHTQHDEQQGHDKKLQATSVVKRSFLAAFLTILIADITMSLDNVLAIGALALGDWKLLVSGLLLSIILVLVGSALVATLIRRLPWLLDVAALVLGWTAARMILDDIRLGPILEHLPWTRIALPILTIAIVLIADILLRLRNRNQQLATRPQAQEREHLTRV